MGNGENVEEVQKGDADEDELEYGEEEFEEFYDEVNPWILEEEKKMEEAPDL